MTSVCTGAAILAQTNLLNGLTATTNKQAFEDVQQLVDKFKNQTIFSNDKRTVPDNKIQWIKKRWVSHLNDKRGKLSLSMTSSGIVTSSGVSAGTDMALFVISNLVGEPVANEVATLMEWNRITDPNQN